MSDEDDKKETPADDATPEQRLWRALRGRRLNDRKFRRNYTIGETGFVVNFVCLEAAVVIDLVGPGGSTMTAEKGRAIKAAKLRLLQIKEAHIQKQFEKTLQLIWRETEQTVKRRPTK